MAIPDIEIKFNKTGFEKEEVMENFNNSKVKYYSWGGKDVVDVIIPYKDNNSLNLLATVIIIGNIIILIINLTSIINTTSITFGWVSIGARFNPEKETISWTKRRPQTFFN